MNRCTFAEYQEVDEKKQDSVDSERLFGKRSMYGRAEFDLLLLRVLHYSKKSLERKHKKKAQQEDHLKTPSVSKKNTPSEHAAEVISEVA